MHPSIIASVSGAAGKTKSMLLSCFSLGLAVSLAVGAVQAQDDNANRPIKDKWAVIIGVGKFANPSIPQLKYPAKDARDFREFLIKNGNFAADHILLLTDEQASREKILDAFGDGWLPRRVMEDDLVVVFISSHGSPADRAGENFVIAYDSNPERPYATSIRLQDLASEVKKRTGCDRLVLLLDACHSGAAVDGQKDLRRSMSNFNLDAITGSGQMVISSSKPDQVSWESKRYPNGVFTHNLIQALQKNGSSTRMSEAYAALKDGVELEVRYDRLAGQTPLMLSKWNGSDLALCAPAAEPRHVPFSEAEIGTTRLNSGPVQSSPTAPPVVKKAPVPSPEVPATMLRSTQPESRAGLLAVPMMTSNWTNSSTDPTLEKGTRLITEEELQGLNPRQLLYLYNEAYARHGRGFATRDIQEYFNKQSWYKEDPDYHWRNDDPKVKARAGQTDDPLVINEKRTPRQWANMQLIKGKMSAK